MRGRAPTSNHETHEMHERGASAFLECADSVGAQAAPVPVVLAVPRNCRIPPQRAVAS